MYPKNPSEATISNTLKSPLIPGHPMTLEKRVQCTIRSKNKQMLILCFPSGRKK